jgi:hemoglobin-like flavoprotein
MTAAAIARIQESYRDIAEPQTLAPIFYARLFERAPSTRLLFPDDMLGQHAHFTVAIAILVQNLDHLGALDEPLRELGLRHAGYGVRQEHYAVFRDTLIDVLAERAGERWSPALRDDWWDALTRVIGQILNGAPEESYLDQTDAFRST